MSLNPETKAKLEELAKTIRMLSVDGVEAANAGHPGLPLGAADMAAVLWARFLRFNPEQPDWINRDRFVLSAGHGSMLLYSLLHLFGYDLPKDELANFRQWESHTPGHPEFGVTSGVETTTGPLGQGFGNGVGIALSGKILSERYGKELFDYRVFGIVSDGDLMEGVASEAASLAGHLRLNNLIYLYDQNYISIGGSTNICFTESVPERFKAYGWNVASVDGHDMVDLHSSLENALEQNDKPWLICARTTIGFGSPNKAGSADVHGAPLGAEEADLTKKNLDWPLEPKFYVPDSVESFCKDCIGSKQDDFKGWQAKYDSWSKTPNAEPFLKQQSYQIPAQLKPDLLSALSKHDKAATRNLSGDALQVIAKHLPGLIGGSADLEPSTKTLIKDSSDINHDAFAGRNLRFGVREHAMGAIANGLAYSKCWLPYTATFLVFSDYMRPAQRLAALSELQVLFIFTHDSFWVGEDGPTHQPIEHIQSLRIIPNMNVYRPADGLEVAMCYLDAIERDSGPSSLLFTRQKVPELARDTGFDPEGIRRGAYALNNIEQPELVLVATGSEVWLAWEAAKILQSSGTKVRVVSMPCQERFFEQAVSFQKDLIPDSARKVSIEAGVTSGWQAVVGSDGLMIGIETFGSSAPGPTLAEKFGFTPESVASRIKEWL